MCTVERLQESWHNTGVLNSLYLLGCQELKRQLQEECEHLKGALLNHQATIEGQVTELNTCKVIIDTYFGYL